MSKIWVSVFWSAKPETQSRSPELDGRTLFRRYYGLLLASVFLTLCTLGISFYPDFLISFSEQAAGQLLNPDSYINAVLNQ
jgi:multicomponent Na+:H+ antiporter subunit D